MFLIDDHQTQVGELDPGDEQPVRADRDIDSAAREPLPHLPCFAIRAQPRHDFDFDRPIGEAVPKRLVVLLREQGRWRKHGHLLAGLDGDERGAHGDFGLAESDIAADEAVGGRLRPKIRQHRVDGLLLIGRRLERELFAEAVVVVVRSAEDGACPRFPARVDIEQLGGHIEDLLRRPPLRLVPLIGTESMQGRVIRVGPRIPGNQVQRGDGHVKSGLLCVVDR